MLCAGRAAAGLPVAELAAGPHRIEAEVAATPDDRALGLMGRTRMPAHRGMLFVFDRPAPHCMWMRNTPLPLSVAFLDDNGEIVNIEDMSPHTETSHCAARPVRLALEMNRGWFSARHLKPGARIGGVARALSSP